MMETDIILRDMRFYAYHGVMPQEQVVGAYYTVNLRMGVDADKAIKTDDINDTIDYGKVYEVIKREMAVNSKLLEHVAGRIIRMLRAEFKKAYHIDIEIFKDTPPLGTDNAKAGVHVRWEC